MAGPGGFWRGGGRRPYPWWILASPPTTPKNRIISADMLVARASHCPAHQLPPFLESIFGNHSNGDEPNAGNSNSWNLPFVERLYADFVRDPASVAADWRRYFEQIRNGERAEAAAFMSPVLQDRDQGAEADLRGSLQYRVNQLVRNYRVRGHNLAAVDPLGRPRADPSRIRNRVLRFSPSWTWKAIVDLRAFSAELCPDCR